VARQEGCKYFLTNVCPSQPDITVRRHGKDVQKPAVVTAYTKRMGGVDRNDQFRKYYYIGRPSVKWYKYIFWFLIDTSICNSHILLSHYRISKGKSPADQLDFRTSLAKQLIAGYSTEHTNKRRKINQFYLDPFNAGRHVIDKTKGRKRTCIQCKKMGNKTAKGRVVETTYECVQCSVTLCKVDCF